MKLYRDPTDPRELDFSSQNTDATGHNLDTGDRPSLRDEFFRTGFLGISGDICANRHKSNPESKAANRRTNKTNDSRLILEALARHPEGLSCEKLEVLCFLKHQTASARVSELKRDGRIRVAGFGKTSTGSPCAIYKLEKGFIYR